jgi:hypothetical protein
MCLTADMSSRAVSLSRLWLSRDHRIEDTYRMNVWQVSIGRYARGEFQASSIRSLVSRLLPVKNDDSHLLKGTPTRRRSRRE